MYLSEIKMKQIQDKPGNNNWIFIYDRSGSMSYVLKKLGEDIIRLGSLLKVGDTLSLAYFSGNNQYRFILKGFQITSDKSIEPIKNAVNSNLSPIGLTCFSEVLHDTKAVINDLKTTFPENTFVLCFLTDGVPCPGGKIEEESIFKALSNLRDLIGDSLFVGYGSFYDKDLMLKMTSEVGGSFVHAEEIQEFSQNVEVIIKNGKSSKKIEIDISDNDDVVLVFGKSGGKIKIYPHKNGKAYVADTEKEVFCVTSKAPKKSDDNLDNLYAGAYSLAVNGNIKESLDWLGKIGDKYLVDKLNNAFTVSETGEAVQAIHDAVFDELKRLIDGFRKNYVPKPDAFCILDALDILTADDNAYFYPNHSNWAYKKMGLPSTMKVGFPKFHKDVNNKCKFSDIVMHKKRLNLSVRTTIKGFIELDDKCEKLKLDKQFKTYQWKNYSIITDGILNIRKIPASMSKETFDVLRKGGLIKKTEKFVENEIYVLDLKRIPIMNRVIGESYKSAKDIAEISLSENENKAVLKTLKYLKDKLDTREYKTTSFTEQYFDEQLTYLFEKGIKEDGSYNPDMDTEAAEDFYMARTFEIKVAGFSSIPKIEDVIKKAELIESEEKEGKKSKKSLNYVEKIIKNVFYQEKDSDLESIEERIRDKAKIIKKLSSCLQRAKFAVILGKTKFDEFGSNEGDIVTDAGIKVSFVFGEEKVKF